LSKELKERFLSTLATLPISASDSSSLEFLFAEALGANPYTTLAELTAGTSVSDTEPVLGTNEDREWLGEATLQPKPLDLPERYWSLGLIGAGSMGEVYRTYDRALRRVLAMKILKEDLKNPELAVVRFVEEAQITAQLEHPGIVPVHDIGQLPDGRWFFTSKEAKGRRLTGIIKEVHAHRLEKGTFSSADTDWSFRRLIDAFHRICVAVAYAHARGVLHRDLKPDNILVGSFGEVLVLDWGLARPLGVFEEEIEERIDEDEFEPVDSDRQQDQLLVTRKGVVAGTPAFMAPEQARAQADLTPASDVYALGGILYMVLFGHHPYESLSAKEVLALVRKGPPPFPPAPWAPLHLVTICRKALNLDPEQRYPDASGLAAEIDAWVEGARNRERAQAMVQAVKGRVPELTAKYMTAVRRRERARRAIERLAPTALLQEKERGWIEEDKSERDLDDVEDAFQDVVQQLRAALLQCPDLLEGRAALADLYRSRYETAVALEQHGRARGFERLVREYDIGHHAAFLQRRGQLTLFTQPPDALVEVYRYETRGRRLVREPLEVTGPTPVEGLSLAAGSYVLVLRAAGRPLVQYPVEVPREAHWNGVPPGVKRPQPVLLPEEGLVPRSTIEIPASWAVFGGDPHARNSPPRQRLWMYTYFIARFPVTHMEYCTFLNDMIRQGREHEALNRLPRISLPGTDELVDLYVLAQGGRLTPANDTPMGPIVGEAPVTMISWHDAVAYCLWLKEATGLPWRLPSEMEREKAARGVDSRQFPWGHHSDPSFHCNQDSMLEQPAPPPIGDFLIDCSPYNVRGLAGGVSDWCMDIFRQNGPGHRGATVLPPSSPQPADTEPTGRVVRRSIRGGSFDGPAGHGRAAARSGLASDRRRPGLGFRLAFSLADLLGDKIDPLS